jgi:hypothetical protein
VGDAVMNENDRLRAGATLFVIELGAFHRNE